MKRITNSKPYKYDVFVRGGRHSINQLASSVFEDEVALEFMKYFPTVLKMEDYVEPKSEVIVPEVEIPKIEPKVVEPKEEIKKVSLEKPKKRVRPKKSK